MLVNSIAAISAITILECLLVLANAVPPVYGLSVPSVAFVACQLIVLSYAACACRSNILKASRIGGLLFLVGSSLLVVLSFAIRSIGGPGVLGITVRGLVAELLVYAAIILGSFLFGAVVAALVAYANSHLGRV